jgi:hypothetical protein
VEGILWGKSGETPPWVDFLLLVRAWKKLLKWVASLLKLSCPKPD